MSGAIRTVCNSRVLSLLKPHQACAISGYCFRSLWQALWVQRWMSSLVVCVLFTRTLFITALVCGCLASASPSVISGVCPWTALLVSVQLSQWSVFREASRKFATFCCSDIPSFLLALIDRFKDCPKLSAEPFVAGWWGAEVRCLMPVTSLQWTDYRCHSPAAVLGPCLLKVFAVCPLL